MSVGQFLAGAGATNAGGTASGGTAVDNTNFLPGWYEDYLQRTSAGALGEASSAYTPYAGQRLAPVSDQTQAVRSRIADQFTNPVYSGALNQAQTAFSSAATPWSGATAAQYMNPYTSNVADELTRRATRSFTQDVMPKVGIGYIGAGQGGSSREYDARNRAATDFEESLQGSLGNVLSTGYGQSMNQFNADRAAAVNAGGALTGLAGTQFGLNAGALGQMASVGQDVQQQQQQSLDLGYQNFQQQQNWNWDELNKLNSVLHGMQIPSSGGAISTPTQLPSGTLQLLAGAGGLAQQFGQMAPQGARRGGLIRRRRYGHGGVVVPRYALGGGVLPMLPPMVRGAPPIAPSRGGPTGYVSNVPALRRMAYAR